MLSLSLLATVVGFVLLVVALMTGNLPLAIACVVVCVVGLILLVVDTLRTNKRAGADEEDEPLFTIRGRESAAREEPLEDDSDESASAAAHSAPDASTDADSAEADSDSADTSGGGVAQYGDSPATSWSLGGDHSSSGLGSVVAPTSERRLGDGPATDPGQERSSSGGDVSDYLRSTGSFPVQRPADPEPQPPTWAPQTQSPQSQAPQSPSGETPARQAAAPHVPAPKTPAPQVPEPQPPAPHAPAHEAAPETAKAEPYVGRRRLAGDPTDDIVVRSASPDLPAMQFVWETPDADTGGSEDEGFTGEGSNDEGSTDADSDDRGSKGESAD